MNTRWCAQFRADANSVPKSTQMPSKTPTVFPWKARIPNWNQPTPQDRENTEAFPRSQNPSQVGPPSQSNPQHTTSSNRPQCLLMPMITIDWWLYRCYDEKSLFDLRSSSQHMAVHTTRRHANSGSKSTHDSNHHTDKKPIIPFCTGIKNANSVQKSTHSLHAEEGASRHLIRFLNLWLGCYLLTPIF